MARFIALVYLGLLSISLQAQSQDLTVELEGCTDDYLLIAHYGGEQILVDDTLYRDPSGSYLYADTTLPDGPYIIVSFADRRYFDYIIDSNDTEVVVTAHWDSLEQRSYTGSPINQAFKEYVQYLTAHQQTVNDLLRREGEGQDVTDAVLQHSQSLLDYQDQLHEDYPGSYISTVLRSQDVLEFPEIDADEEAQLIHNYHYRLDHFFDRISDDPRFFRSRYFKGMVTKYIDEYTIQRPDSLAKSMMTVLDMVQEDEDVFQFYLVQWINQYAESSRINDERIWVQLTDRYITTGLADNFVPAEAKNKMIKRAAVQSKSLIGLTAQDLTMPVLDIDSTLELSIDPKRNIYYDLRSEELSLHDLEGELIVVFFWKPSCGHCQEAFPVLIDLMREYDSLGLQSYAVNVGSYKQYQEAAEYIREHDGEIISHMVDPEYTSRYAERFAVLNTPAIYILDSDFTILYNRMGAQQLREFVERALKDKGLIGSASME